MTPSEVSNSRQPTNEMAVGEKAGNCTSFASHYRSSELAPLHFIKWAQNGIGLAGENDRESLTGEWDDSVSADKQHRGMEHKE